MIKVWTDVLEAGFLDRLSDRGTTFLYEPQSSPARAVSLTMPVRLPSWNTSLGLAPIFEMNLPEGALRERLRLAFAKATGSFDDYALLAIVGRSQVGRIRYTGAADQLDETVPFQSVEEIIASRRSGELFRYLLEKFAAVSGISGVQPKVLVRDESVFPATYAARKSQSHKGATHIVKFWEPNEFPHLATNEFFCLQAAERCELEVPKHRLSDDGMALVVDRFDRRANATYRGFEDFCVLNARRTDEKYRGSYETSIMKRFQQFSNSPHVNSDMEKLFTLIALNCALRNGDAHLKNFGVIYEDVLGEARLAPVYDLVTTTAYLPQDGMALTLNGTTQWPTAKELRRLGETRMTGTPAHINQILKRIADALSQTAHSLRVHAKDHPETAAMVKSMLHEWEVGCKHSLAA